MLKDHIREKFAAQYADRGNNYNHKTDFGKYYFKMKNIYSKYPNYGVQLPIVFVSAN